MSDELTMQDLRKKRCAKCDFMNNKRAIAYKEPNCKGTENLTNCEIYTETIRLENRIEYLLGNSSPMFICGKDGCDIYTWKGEE